MIWKSDTKPDGVVRLLAVFQSTAAAIIPTVVKNKKVKKMAQSGDVLACRTGIYTFHQLLGAGGYGEVHKYPDPPLQYRLEVSKLGADYAIKVEDIVVREDGRRLKMEMAVFADIKKCASPIDKRHFIRLIDQGTTERFRYIIMELVSSSLHDLRTRTKGDIPLSTTLHIGRETLQSIEALHSIGYLHRDIKPQNFAIGLPPLDNKIYMLDFGLARKYINANDRLRIPREKVVYMGTLKYASRACHKEKEQCRSDDVEVWCYMMLEFFNTKNISWKSGMSMEVIGDLKNKLMANCRGQVPPLDVPPEFLDVIETIAEWTYTTSPPYCELYDSLNRIGKKNKIDRTLPLDWIGKKMKKVKEAE